MVDTPEEEVDVGADHTRTPAIVWFRRDLRVTDNPALDAAAATEAPILPVFVWAPQEEDPWQPGPAARWWLVRSLETLDRSLRALDRMGGPRGAGLLVLDGTRDGSAVTIARLALATGAARVFACRVHEPSAASRDAAATVLLRSRGVALETTVGQLMCEPGDIRSAQGGPMRVFTPFWRRCASMPRREPVPAPASLALLPAPDADRDPALSPADVVGGSRGPGTDTGWEPGEHGALERLEAFVSGRATGYARDRDRVDLDGTSRLSPHLHFGEISPSQVLASLAPLSEAGDPGAAALERQLYWREFAHDVLAHFPETPTRSMRPEFERFPWSDDQAALDAWREGRTGYPLVDAAMRQLDETGWMHNRARLVVASFLTKDLLLGWQHGARHFWERLADADLADNTFGWQWTAGSGADAAPYFRVFNPTLQGERFDPTGDYVRRWLPELALLPDRVVHRPWEASAGELADAGIVMGRDYPRPIVDHAEARRRALAAFTALR
jgi:deoxyribodipyrimidine photo-lyase